MSDFSSFIKRCCDGRFILGFALSILALALLYLLNIDRDLLFTAITVLFCLSVYFLTYKKSEAFVFGLLAAVTAMSVAYYLYTFRTLYSSIIEWDFLAFYVYGKAGADGLKLYDPSQFTNILAGVPVPFQVGKEFVDSILKVGVSYPPTTMLLLAPFGALDLYTANIAWRTLILLCIIADIYLIYKHFIVHQTKWIQLFLVASLLLILRGSFTTVFVGQTVFLMLFFILMIYRDPDHWSAGLFLALAITLKPIAAIWGLYYLINWKWKPAIAFAVTGFVIVALSIGFFGIDNFVTFFTSNPTKRIPEFVYTDAINQSMNAVFNRTFHNLGMDPALYNIKGIVIWVSIAFVLITFIAAMKIAKRDHKESFLILLPLSLLIYPNCSLYYAPMLLPLFFTMLIRRDQITFLLFVTFIFLLIYSCFAANLLILTVFLFYAFRNQMAFSSLKPPQTV